MNKTALITGASSGIGLELAKIHAKKGGNLILVARREEKLVSLKEEIQKDHNVQVDIISMDLSEIGAGEKLYNKVQDLGLPVDYLINNAGFGGRGYFHERAWEDDKQMIQLNILSLTEITRFFLPDMVARDSGKILNVSSTASFMPGPLQAVYFASKSYVQFFSNALFEELSHTNVTVTNLMPGATQTEFADTADMTKTGLFQEAVSAYSVAIDGYDAMMEGKLDVISGLTFWQTVMMKMIPFTPTKIMMKQIRKMQEVK